MEEVEREKKRGGVKEQQVNARDGLLYMCMCECEVRSEKCVGGGMRWDALGRER